MNLTEDFRKRLKPYAIRVIRLYTVLPKNAVTQVIGRQLLRSGTSAGAIYCEAMRARSRAEFISKVEISLQELEETRYWLELLVESDVVKANLLQPILDETLQLNAILTASSRTAKSRLTAAEPRR